MEKTIKKINEIYKMKLECRGISNSCEDSVL